MGIRDTWKAAQIRWATENGCSPDEKGYVGSLLLNLFQPMSPDTKAEFADGGGGEIHAGRRARRPKMHALHSSSALVCNVFDYWRSNGLSPVGKAIGINECIEGINFEAKIGTGLPGEPPNLDIALRLGSGDVWGIESKFTEPFGSSKSGPAFKEKYFPADGPIWSGCGLTRCSALASALQTGEAKFRHLDAPQLLKHALGLQNKHKNRFALCYLYADQDNPECERHRKEISDFANIVNGDFPFVSLSYGTLLDGLLKSASGDHDAYFTYVCKRYKFMGEQLSF